MRSRWGKWPIFGFVFLVSLAGTQGKNDPLFLARLEWEKPILKIPEGPFPLTVQAFGPMGGWVEQRVDSVSDLDFLKIPSGVITDKNPNPPRLSLLPKLCPRLEVRGGSQENSRRYVYQGLKDRLNHVPMLQLSENGGWRSDQYKSYSGMDGQNVLLLKKITLRYDYEDSAIVDYEGPAPRGGKVARLHEKNSGFYANLHYAIVPFKEAYRDWSTQDLLHLAQGRLQEIGRSSERPKLRTHSFLPGPFSSGASSVYEMCEWGDTAYQAPLQELEYEDLALWDFDYPVAGSDHVLMIVFESDHEDHLLKNGLIPRSYLVDDLVGVFEIKKEDFEKETTLKNKNGDFEITLQVGDFKNPAVAWWKEAIPLSFRTLY